MLRLDIVDYFDSLRNQIDLKAETALLFKVGLSERERKQINDKRQLFIDEIKRIEAENLQHLDTSGLSRLASETERAKLFKAFCFLVDTNELGRTSGAVADELEVTEVGRILGYLIILNEYLSAEQLEIFRQLLSLTKSEKALDLSNKFFNLKLQECETSLLVRRVCHLGAECIIRPTDLASLLSVSDIQLKNVIIESIKPEAEFLFKNMSRISFVYTLNSTATTRDAIHTMQQFQAVNIRKFKFRNHRSFIEDDLNLFNYFKNLEELSLCSWWMHTVPDRLRSFVKLKKMKLYCAGIECIESSLFEGLVDLEKLNLGMNRIRSLAEETFASLVNLKRLDLSRNRIARVQNAALSGLVSLVDLNLYCNCLHAIDASLFAGLAHLQKLNLSLNGINRIEVDAFDSLKSLKELNLRFNKVDLGGVDSAPRFRSLKNLEHLNLCDNQITTIERHTFLGLASLITLTLQTNPITRIDTLAFAELSKLEILYLSRSQMSLIDRTVIKNDRLEIFC